ncbi:MAG: HigA family addiction module antidote protein [Alistipes sp.]|jgi:addiction module HigA family antidote|nr:HigA family addiction module antidote protein [Alistipes sp.]
MNRNIEPYKGIHPGRIIDRELKKRGTSQRSIAAAIGEHSQNLNAVITGRRRLTIELALRLENALGMEEGFLLALQAYYDIAEYKHRQAAGSVSGRPDVRRGLFWDTDFDRLDFGRYRGAVIQRVLERGSNAEIAEIARFYGLELSELDGYKPTNSYRINSAAGQQTNR